MTLSLESNRLPIDSSFFRQIARSPLSSQILRGLIIAAAAELILIAGVGFNLVQSGKAAEREFLLLQASARLAVILKAGRELWEQAGELRRVPSAHAYREYRTRYALLLSEVSACDEILKKVHVTQNIVNDTEKSLLSLDSQEQEIFQRQQHGDRQSPKYELWKVQSTESLAKSVEVIDEVHKSIHAQTQSSTHYEQLVVWLMSLALLLNLILVIFGFRLIRTRVTKPIIRLAADCNRILEGEAIPIGPSRALNEISSLENTFRTMSVALSETDKQRKNFQELFRNVLSKSLRSVDNGLSQALSALGETNVHADESDSSKLKRMLLRCKNGLQHLQSILNSLTTSLDPSAEKNLTVSLEEVNVAILVERSLLSVDSLLKERQLSVAAEGTPLAVHLDNQLLQRVITNFLSNAIKYSPLKGQITVKCEEQAGSWQLSVRDQGPGISHLERKKLFTRFGQLESTDGKKRAGTGLGLVICKEIIEAHGGIISCDSAPGEGSTFWFRMPKTGKPLPKSTVSSAQTREEAGPASRSKVEQGAAGGTVRAKIGNYYIGLLVVFLLAQVGTIILLAGRFQQISTQSTIFSNQKERFLKNQECLTSLINGRLQIISDFENDDMADLRKTFTKIESLPFPATDNLTTGNAELDQVITRLLNQMDRHKKILMRISDSLLRGGAEISKFQAALIYPSAKKAFVEVENDCYMMMDLEQQSIRNSYAVSTNLRNQIASALFVDLFINLIVFALAARHTLMLVSRANLLADKASAFSAGQLPAPDQVKDDELAWLDERFCQAAAQLQSAEEKKQALMAVVNHDLRTPVNSILLTLEGLVTDTADPSAPQTPTLATALITSKTELEELFNRVNNFLLIEKLHHTSTPPKFETIPLDGIVEGLLDMMTSRRSIDSSRLVPEFEDVDADWIIHGEPRLIETMILELLMNALKFSPPESKVVLHWSVSNAKDRLNLDIKNDGPGINPELAPQIFDRYRTLGGIALPGLGLPLAATIASIHGGQLQLLSNDAGGCTFRISLPLK